MIKAKLLVDHDSTDSGYHEWFLTGDGVYRDSLCRRNVGGAYRRYTIAICNNPWCPARAYIADAVFSRAAEEALPTPSDKRRSFDIP